MTVNALERVRDLTKVDLLTGDGSAFQQIGEDPRLMVDVLFALVMPQAETEGVSDVEFGESMSGPVMREAYEGFLEEVVDFFQFNPIRGRVMLMALDKTREMEQRAGDLLEQRINDPAVMAAMEREVDALGQKLTDSLGSPASTPDR